MAEKYKWVKHPEFPDDANKNGLLYAEDGINYRVSISRSDTDSYLYDQYQAWVDAGNTVEAADASPTDWDLARRKRDKLLRDSDWTMTTGATVDQAQWSAYREKLRDIPQTYKGKETSEIVWPATPSAKGPNTA